MFVFKKNAYLNVPETSVQFNEVSKCVCVDTANVISSNEHPV